MFYTKDESGYQGRSPLSKMKTLVYGEKTLMAEFRSKAGNVLKEHSHPYEQTGYVVQGKLTLFIDGVPHQASAGDAWCIAADVPHGAEAIEDTIVVEVFSPARKDYKP